MENSDGNPFSDFNDFGIYGGLSLGGWISVPSVIGDKEVPSPGSGFFLCINSVLDSAITLR